MRTLLSIALRDHNKAIKVVLTTLCVISYVVDLVAPAVRVGLHLGVLISLLWLWEG
jgi:hypothetical protein